MTAIHPDLEIIEALDFENTPECEHGQHPSGDFGHAGPAWALVERLVCLDHKSRFFYICRGGWEDPALACCGRCGYGSLPREQTWRFVSLVKGA